MTQLADYRSAVRLRGYDGTTDAQVDDAIAEARRRVFQDRRWSFLQAADTTLGMLAGISTVSLATITDLMHIDRVRLTDASGDPVRLTWKPLPEIRDLQDEYPDAQGAPYHWTRYAGQLVFFPAADATYMIRVEYAKYPGVLIIATTDIIPEQHKDLVVWASIVPLAFRQRDFPAASAADSHYRDVLLPRHAAQDATEQRGTSRQVRSGYWD